MSLVPRSFFLDDFFDDFGKVKVQDMKCDIYEEDNNYVVEMDIPGFNKDEIDIDVEKGYLTIVLLIMKKKMKKIKIILEKKEFMVLQKDNFMLVM